MLEYVIRKVQMTHEGPEGNSVNHFLVHTSMNINTIKNFLKIQYTKWS